MKNKADIDSILLANWYFINCKKTDNFGCQDIARKYITLKIKKALSDRKKNQSNRTFSFLNIL